ncbi:protein sickie isoform X2 [Agrilus planipennis]|uniref:Protein sickie isoform X2 n=1 Tax=Agrilus planipennis TaxID=224129 RepID=A0A1W4X5F7_AGRPL|nr:protein sickie isoform X2 [Agrilus planipennis]
MLPGCIKKPAQGSTDDVTKQTESIIQIYTDWANYYLEKSRNKKRFLSLARDCCDGVLLADLIESVTNQKIPDINRKPQTSVQMLENISSCLNYLRAKHVSGIETISPQDLRDGDLKTVLALFFALSRHKQVSKQRSQALQAQPKALCDMAPNRSLAVSQKTCASSIPLPDSALPSRKCPPDKVRPVTIPNPASNTAQSLIPRVPVPSSNNRQQQQQSNNVQQQKKNALTKLKIFKSGDSKPTPVTTGKRTSSSSGVSSAKSERSDSSTVSLEHSSDARPAKGNSKLKQTRSIKTTTGLVKVTPSATKKDATNLKQPPRTASDIERHAQKLANLPASKLAEPKLKVTVSRSQQVSPALVARSPTPQSPGTGIPKPVAAVKGVNKVHRDDRENPHISISPCVPGATQIPEESFAKDNETTSECSNTSSTEIQGYSSSISCANTSIPEEPDVNGADVATDSGFVQNKQPLVYVQRPLGPLAEKAEEREQSNHHGNHLSQERIMVDVESNYSNMTLPSKKQFSFIYPDTNGLHYSDIALTNGYLSDGEVLRNPTNNPNNDGYLSEGGSNLYSRRIQITLQRQRLPNSAGLVPPGFTVLTGQTVRRGRSEETPPPPPAPRVSSRSKGTSTGSQVQESKHGQWKRYMDTPGMGSPPPPAPSSPTSGRKEKRSSPHGSSKEKSSKVRGIPQNFGYVKKTNGSSATHNPNGPNCTPNGNALLHTGLSSPSNKPTQVSVVPRTKVKVSGGTQTCSSDLQESHKANPQYKSYSLTGNTATQLSQSVRERLLMGSQSLPKGSVAVPDPGLILRQARPKVSDGSLSDTQALDGPGPYTPWLRHSNTYSVAPRLSETDSLESLSSLPGHRGSLTHARLLRDSPSRLSRSNSIRNVEPEIEPYYCLPVGAVTSHWSQPTSPAPSSTRTFPLSPTHSTPRHSIPKNDDVHGSSVSLVSTTSSLYSSAEEKQAHEIRKLRKELIDAQEKVHTLTSQLSTNAHVVAAFEQSLTSMTQRLQHLTATSEKKDSELAELRAAMDSLRAQTIQAGFGKVNSSSSGLSRQLSSDSVSSISSACSIERHEKKKKKGWLRSSFTKAFSRNAKVTKVTTQTESETERSHSSPPPSVPPPQAPIDTGAEVAELQKQLREKDLVLTDIRLEALSSAHQLESLKDTVMKMRSEMLSLKQNNERLQRLVGGSANVPPDVTNSGSMDPIADLIPLEEPPPELESDGKRITISVYLGQPQTFDKYYSDHYGNDKSEFSSAEIPISHTSIGASTSWVQLDNSVRRAFKQHLARLDPGGGLGLGGDAILSYKLGDAERRCDTSAPDLLPVGYVVGNVTSLHIVLQPLAALSFEALIPKGVAQRLVSLLTEHRRIVFCGAPGTGKTYLATRLAEFHAQAMGRDPTEAVATFNCDNKSGKELRQYLSHLNEQATSGDNNDFPCVVILDNLHKAGPFPDALGSLSRSLPCLLGTMAQSACSATSLQLQHGFRWVLVAPHMEPARGLLGRVLRRRLATVELEQGPQTELAAVLGWLPRVWQHLNAFLETHSSGDVAIGPRLFLGCPLELDAARAWFADVWNYSLAPYLREAAREGLQLYGKRSAWIDPLKFILDTYPWPGASPQGLTSISARDVGLEISSSAQSENEGDPLLNMIMRLQEAANCSSPHSNDSKNNTIDNTLTQNNRVDNKNSL